LNTSVAVVLKAVRTLTTGQVVAVVLEGLLAAAAIVALVSGRFTIALGLIAVLIAISSTVAILQQRVLTSRIDRSQTRSQQMIERVALASSRSNEARQQAAREGTDILAGDPWSLTTTQWWARRLRDKPQYMYKFVRFAKRVRGHAPLDVLAYLASSGRYDYKQLSEHLNQGAGRKKHRLAEDAVVWWVPGLLCFARTIVAHVSMPNARLLARLTYDLVRDIGGDKALKSMDRSLYGDLLLDAGMPGASMDVLSRPCSDVDRERNQRLLVANALNPAIVGSDSELQGWLEQVNPLFVEHGFSPIAFRSGSSPSFYEVIAPSAVPVQGGPLVSVVMPIYEPTDETDVAIASILDQTWQNLELIIVDDGSPQLDATGRETGYADRLERWAATSDRVRLIFNEKNRGAYWARNTGYDAARGKYLTIADKDDWHHPERIEAQVARLEADDELVACNTNWARVTKDMRFIIRWGPDRVIHPSFASTMFRRAAIRERLGYWDSVRKGADSEFLARMRLAFGFEVESVTPVPLAFSFLGAGNLTSEDVGMGYESHSRRTYREAYTGWHARLREEGTFHLGLSAEDRSFPAPAEFLPAKNGIGSCDVIYVADFAGQEADAASDTVGELRDLVKAGYTVAILAASDPMRWSDDVPRLDLESLVAEGAVTRFAVSEPVAAQLVVVRSPRALHVDQYVRSQVRSKHSVVVADQPPFKYGSGERLYDPTVVAANVQSAFGSIPQWHATTPSTAKKLDELIDGEPQPNSWAGALDAAELLELLPSEMLVVAPDAKDLLPIGGQVN
jgi:membrane protein implicated in regulation of membrane protease activity